MSPRRYKLLKDLPGCPKGTVFEQQPPYMGIPVMTGGIPGDASFLVYPDKLPDWFAPITEPERPYPWEPGREEYWFVDVRDRKALKTTNVWAPYDTATLHNAAAFRTKEDAELALKGLPLYNKAVQAKINESRGEDELEPHFHVVWSGDDFRVGACTAFKSFGHRDGPQYKTEKNAEDVARHLNFFTAPPHAE